MREEAAERQGVNSQSDTSSSSSSSSSSSISDDLFSEDELSAYGEEFPDEALMFQANEHCLQAQAQRELANQRIQEAKATKNHPWSERW
jgi:hypothetical protein